MFIDIKPFTKSMKIQNKEIVTVVVFIVLMAFLQLLPTLSGYAAQGDKIYLGFEFPADMYVYASFVEDAEHKLFLENKQTSDPQLGRYFLPLFSVMAQAAKLGLEIPHVFIAFRFAEIIVFLAAAWIFLGLIFLEFRQRLFALAFVSLAGGFGWVLSILVNFMPAIARIKSSDITFWLGYSLVGNMYAPHKYWAFALALLGFMCVLVYTKTNRPRYLIASGAIALAIFFIHPVTAIFFVSTIVVMQLWLMATERTLTLTGQAGQKILKQSIMSIAALAIFLAPAVAYSYWASQDELISAHQKIYFFISKIEPLPFYFVGFGLVLILGILGLRKIREEKPLKILLLAWALTSFSLTRIGFGVEYLIFFFFIMAIFAAKWILSVEERIPKIALFILVTASVLSAPFVLLERTNWMLSDPLSFVTPEEKAALDFLKTQPKGIVISDKRIGEIVSWQTPHKPVISHSYLTMNISDKIRDVNEFFVTRGHGFDAKILDKYHVNYLWVAVGPERDEKQKTLFGESPPKTDSVDLGTSQDSIKLIYSNPQVSVYKYKG